MVTKELLLEQQNEEDAEKELYDTSELVVFLIYNFITSFQDRDKNRPTFYPLLHFIAIEFVHKMGEMKCPLSGLSVLPRDPTKASASTFERLYCGCWFEKKALLAHLREPPFSNVECPSCHNPLASQKYTKDFFRGQEQRWMQRQRKIQELNDVSDFLGL